MEEYPRGKTRTQPKVVILYLAYIIAEASRASAKKDQIYEVVPTRNSSNRRILMLCACCTSPDLALRIYTLQKSRKACLLWLILDLAIIVFVVKSAIRWESTREEGARRSVVAINIRARTVVEMGESLLGDPGLSELRLGREKAKERARK